MGQIMAPFEWAVAWVMYLCHEALAFIFPGDGSSSAEWVLSIVGLVIVMRVIMIPLFFRQIRASRAQMLLQPEMQAIQKKYKNRKDPAAREAMSRETMALYKKHGTSPLASCMPILVQAPFFFALFRVLQALPRIAAGERGSIGPMDQVTAAAAEQSTIFGAQLSSWFLQTGAGTETRIVSIILILAMASTQFITQRQLTMKNMPPAALQGPMAQTQKIMMYGMPVIMAISGVNFPIGVLIYWTTTNLWSTGQQFYTIRKMPAPGSEAEKRYNERRAKKAAHKGIVLDSDQPTVIKQPTGQREQPVSKSRQKKKSKKRK